MSPANSISELLRRYEQGEREFRKSELDAEPYGDLRHCNLSGIDLSESYVVASFVGADLSRAKFVDANVKTCDFSGADLRRTDFSGAAIDGAVFVGANMDGATFEGASSYGIKLADGQVPEW